MHPIRKKRLYIILGILSSVAVCVTLVLYALNQNLNAFYTPNQISSGEAPENVTMRIGGLVKENTLKEDKTQSSEPDIEFVVTDNMADVVVRYSGIVPDLFREGQGVVATGKLVAEKISGQRTFVASEILAKHDENYMPKEVQDALEEQGLMNHAEKTGQTEGKSGYGYGSSSGKKAAYQENSASY